MTAFAEWLNTFFYAYDAAILTALHSLAEACGGFFTPFFALITLLGEKGIIFFLAAAVMMLFKRTRRIGVCLFGAVCCGALITNICLKDLIARPRPFETVELFKSFWEFVGSPAEDGFSFPSGHVTAAAAGAVALALCFGKKYIAPAAAWIILMGISRNYLMAHYPSDVLCAMIVGAVSAIVAYYITKLIYHILEKYNSNKFFAFVLNFDVVALFKKN